MGRILGPDLGIPRQPSQLAALDAFEGAYGNAREMDGPLDRFDLAAAKKARVGPSIGKLHRRCHRPTPRPPGSPCPARSGTTQKPAHPDHGHHHPHRQGRGANHAHGQSDGCLRGNTFESFPRLRSRRRVFPLAEAQRSRPGNSEAHRAHLQSLLAPLEPELFFFLLLFL